MSDPHPPDQTDARPAAPPARGWASWRCYGVAFAAVAAATLLMFVLYGVLGVERGRVPFIFFFGAVLLSAQYGGRGPGLFSVVLSALVADYFFVPPLDSLALDYEGVLQTVVFVLVALVIVFVTEKSRRAARAARASEESLSTTLRSIGDAVIATDAGGRVTFMNPVAERLTGWSSAEARGRPLTEVFRIVNEETRTEVESPVEKVLREGAVVGLANHTVLISKEGAETPVDDSGAPIKNESGEIVGVVLVFHDITGRRQAEAALRKSEERLRTIAETASDAIITIDEESTIRFANSASGKIFGYAPDEMRGAKLTTLMPDYLRRAHESALGRYLETGRRHISWEGVELPGLRRDGHEIPLEVSFAEFVEDGRHYFTGIARDITERKQAEEARARLAAIVESSDDAILGKTLDGIITSWNTAAERVYGYAAGEVVGRHISVIVPAELSGELGEILRRLNDGERVEHLETVRLRKDGSRINVSITVSPIRDAAGRIVGASTIAHDITERRRAEAELRASEARYRALADAMPQIVWTARPDGYLDYYNKRWLDYTGMTLEQTQGWGWQPVLHPDDLERCLRRWATAVETGEEFEINYRIRRAANGEYRWHLGRGKPLHDAEGRIVKWFGTATDIHDQKQAEDRFRFLAEAGALLASSLDYETTLARLARLSVSALADHCVIDVIGDDGRVRRVATAHADPSKEELVRDLSRFPPAPDESVGIPSVLLTGRPEIVPELTEEMLATLSRGDEHLEALRRLGPKSFMVVPLGARGRTIGAITLGLDASGRRYTRADLDFAEELARRAALAIDNARLYSRAQEANRAKDEFLATLSHELRTPLTPVIGWVQMIRDGYVGEREVAQGLEVIYKNAEALSRLISDLLDMTSILSGKMRIERATVELTSVVREAAETVRPQADRAGVVLEVSFDADGGPPPLVSGDRTRLVQVFWNLLTNAVKFSRAGGRVRVECRADGESSARVEVADEGSGIEPEFLPHVFDRFTQADSSTRRAHGGLGLGLALVKSFVEAHGGTATASSAGPGQGSRFSVTLPLLRIADCGLRIEEGSLAGPTTSDDAATPQVTNPQSAIRNPQSVRVLVVEDARDTLDMLRVVFGMWGYEAVACETAEEALRVAPSARFDIIVSDIGLPRIDGFELIRRLRELPHLRDTPAVALTGYAAPKDAEAALAAGFDAHVPKPVEPSALAEEIKRLLLGRSGQSGSEA